MDQMLYRLSIPAISSLQGALADQAAFMQLLSTVFDPKYAFLVYSPIAYLLDAQVGKRLIMTTVLAEWLNQVLKWLLHGERPYWYVHSSGLFDPKATPIRQFPITCELGPGHPSGHAMVTAAVWYIILSACQQAYANYRHLGHLDENPKAALAAQQQQQQQQVPGAVRLTTWASLVGLLLLVSVSRVFLGCHFPHQCLAGALLGLFVARWVSSREIQAHHYLGAAAFLFASAFGTFGLLQALGFDPSWTIRLATTYCVKRDYIHLDTAPFFSIMRYCGFALGCGLGLLLPLKPASLPKELVKSAISTSTTASTSDLQVSVHPGDELDDVKSLLSSRNISWLSFKLVMALLMARLVDNLGLFVSHSNLGTFYSCAFAAYTLFSYAFVNL